VKFEDFQPMWSRYFNVTETERRTTCRGNTAFCVASRGKNVDLYSTSSYKTSNTRATLVIAEKNCFQESFKAIKAITTENGW